jgi:hypothetical protein
MIVKLLLVASLGTMATLQGQSRAPSRPPSRWPAIQNWAHSLSLSVDKPSVEAIAEPKIAGRILSLKTISTSFTAEGASVYTLYVSCSALNYYSVKRDAKASPSDVVHSIPLYRHQASGASGKDRFSGLFSGSIACLSDEPIRFKILRDASKDKEPVSIGITVSAIIEDVPTTSP